MINISKIFRSLLLTLLIASTLVINAQQVDIGLFQADENTLEVRLKPNGSFNGIVSNVAFTVRWKSDNTNALGTINQGDVTKSYIPMVKSGNVIEHDGYKYQVFAGFGMQPMSKYQSSWQLTDEIVLMTIPVTGNAKSFELVNDSWTGEVRNNGDYYVSLGGIDKTGYIYKNGPEVATGVGELDKFNVKIYLNPVSEGFSIEASFDRQGSYTVEILDITGRKVFIEELNDYQGAYNKFINLKKHAGGVYLLKIQGEESRYLKEIVKL